MTDVRPDPPPDLPYGELEDWYAAHLLARSGVDATDTRQLVAVLQGSDHALRAPAAHQLGKLGETATADAVPALAAALADAQASGDDDIAVEAAWALARLGEERGRRALEALAAGSVTGSVAPLQAAGFLARLGEPHAIDRVREGLASDNFLVRVVAAKQLFFFAPLDRGHLGVQQLFERALADDEEDVRWAAQVQLRDLDGPQSAST